jgi:hypothetical protein
LAPELEGQAEIHQHGLELSLSALAFSDHDVLEFYVAVDEALRVHIGKPLQKLPQQLFVDAGVWESISLDKGEERKR